MNACKYIFALLLAGGLAAPLPAQDVEAVVQRRAQAAQLPPTDSAILYHGTTYVIQDDGRVERTEHVIRYLRTDNAWDDYGDPHLAWDTERQDLEVLVSRVHTVDGRKIDTTPNGFNPIVPFGLDLAPDFTRYHQMVVTHLGIETDAVTELKYVVKDREPLYPFAWGEVIFGGPEPVLERTVRVQMDPPGRLLIREDNGAPKALHLQEAPLEAWVWTMKDLPARHTGDPGAKPGKDLPRVTFSTARDWASLAGAVQQRFDAASDRSVLERELAAFRDLAGEQKLDSVTAFVQDRIALKNFDAPGMLLTFRPANRVLATGYGSPADLAAFHAAAFQAAGMNVEAYLQCRCPMTVPQFTGREIWLLHVTGSGIDAWVETAHGDVSYRMPQGGSLIGISPVKEPKLLPQASSAENTLSLDLGLTFAEDRSAQGWFTLKASGDVAPYDECRSQKAEDVIRGWLTGLYGDLEVTNARVTALNPSAVEIQAEVMFTAGADSASDFLRLALPWKVSAMDGFLPHGLTLNDPGRDMPLHLDCAGAIEANAQIRYPEAWTLAVAPAPAATQMAVTAQGPEGTATASPLTLIRQVDSKPGLVTVNERVEFTDSTVPPPAWNDWRKVVLAAAKDEARTVVLEPGE